MAEDGPILGVFEARLVSIRFGCFFWALWAADRFEIDSGSSRSSMFSIAERSWVSVDGVPLVGVLVADVRLDREAGSFMRDAGVAGCGNWSSIKAPTGPETAAWVGVVVGMVVEKLPPFWGWM